MAKRGKHHERIARCIENLGWLVDLYGERRRQLARGALLTEAQWRVLEEIEGEAFMPSLFARRRALNSAAVSRTLRQLLDDGLISVEIARADARQREYRLTRSGRGALARVASGRERALEKVWSALSAEELDAFARISGKLNAALEAHLKDVQAGAARSDAVIRARSASPPSRGE